MSKFAVTCTVAFCLFFVSGVRAAAPDGAAIFKEHCAPCHGAEGQTPKGNSPEGIRMLSSDEVQRKIMGYADGSYGGSSKAIMQNVAKGVQPDQLKAVADYIGDLKK